MKNLRGLKVQFNAESAANLILKFWRVTRIRLSDLKNYKNKNRVNPHRVQNYDRISANLITSNEFKKITARYNSTQYLPILRRN